MSNVRNDINELLKVYSEDVKKEIIKYMNDIIEENDYMKDKMNLLKIENERLRNQNIQMHYKLKFYRNREENEK